MPDLTGFEVLREIKRKPLKKSIPVIIHSSKDLTPAEVGELKALGAIIFAKREFKSVEGSESLREVLGVARIAK